ncbi:DUF5818 domain-containing protein [Aurantiacibacter flavus]|uniref:DUF5818 domain-containing protein n=1 Tax=Aurantiacibacter flavus TaxID=3145232 RepID=A0ABV0CT59_9SPHN
MKSILPATAVLALAACSSGDRASGPSPDDDVTLPTAPAAADPAGTRPSGTPSLVTVEGRLDRGTECAVITTPDGEKWSVNLGEADFGTGDYVEITGEIADASFCMEGQGTLLPSRIEAKDPPARGRDPARAGGTALTEEYLVGSWVAKGLRADCNRPDFTISRSPGALVIEGEIEGHDNDAAIVLGNYQRIDLDEPMPDLPIESRGPDGLAILRPATDAAYDPVSIGSATITGDGVVFVKCG